MMKQDFTIKTICTIGPASFSEEVLEELVAHGMDIARLNFSHASHDQLLYLKEHIEHFNKKHHKNTEILIDLQGPRIRVGMLPKEGIEMHLGQEVTFTTDLNNPNAIFIDDPHLHNDIKLGHPLYLANGDMEFEVLRVDKTEVYTKVVDGGVLFSRKGVNLPETDLTTGGMTEKDLIDARFGLEQGIDYIAVSFVKHGQDLVNLRAALHNDTVKLVSKVERKQAIYNIDSIIDESDVIMVARGDLGIELPLATLPVLQKQIMAKCRVKNKPAIVATQMLLSMVENPRPTRAEVSDVANAVFDGAWAVMLSDETAFGKYPVQALDYLVETARCAQEYLASQ